MNLEQFWKDQAAWSQATFGTDAERGPLGPTKHLAKEVLSELLCLPRDQVVQVLEKVDASGVDMQLGEFVDCQFLIFDACRRAGFTYEQLVAACFAKLEVNKARKWGKASTTEAVEHIREE